MNWRMMVMDVSKAKEMASQVMKTGYNRIYIDPANIAKVAEAMTKDDIRGLIADRIIKKKPEVGQSRGRARANKIQTQKGRRRGKGKRAGTKKVRMEERKAWINRVRAQRKMLRELRKTNPKAVEAKNYGEVYRKIKGNYFKGKNYLKEYIENQ